MPSLENLKTGYKDKPFRVLLVNVMESEKTVRDYLKKEDINVNVVFDRFGKVSAQFGVRSHPVKFLIDGSGNLMATGLGYRDWNSDEMKKLVNILIRDAEEKPQA